MFKFYSLCFILTFLFKCVSLQSVPVNPCPNIFTYINDGYKTYGQVKVAGVYSSTINLVVKLSLPTQLHSHYVGEIHPTNPDLNVVKNELSRTGFLNYNVFFPVYQPLPLITEIQLNGQQVCSGPPAVSSYITTIHLSHNIFFDGAPIPVYGVGTPVAAPSDGSGTQVFPQNPPTNANSQFNTAAAPASPCPNQGFITRKTKYYLVTKGQKIQIETDAVDENFPDDGSRVLLLEEELKFTPLEGSLCLDDGTNKRSQSTLNQIRDLDQHQDLNKLFTSTADD